MNGSYFKIDLTRNKFYLAYPQNRNEQWRKEAEQFWKEISPIEALPFAEFKLDLEHFNLNQSQYLLDFLIRVSEIPVVKVICLFTDKEDMQEITEEFSNLFDEDISLEFVLKK